jgi:hypothetical protein
MDGRESRVKDCLQQTKSDKIAEKENKYVGLVKNSTCCYVHKLEWWCGRVG